MTIDANAARPTMTGRRGTIVAYSTRRRPPRHDDDGDDDDDDNDDNGDAILFESAQPYGEAANDQSTKRCNAQHRIAKHDDVSAKNTVNMATQAATGRTCGATGDTRRAAPAAAPAAAPPDGESRLT